MLPDYITDPNSAESCTGRTRTCDNSLNRRTLLPTELRYSKLKRLDLNQRSSVYQTDAFTRLSYVSVQNERLELSRTVWKTVMLPITSILLSCGLTSSHTPLELNHKLRSCSGVGENRQRYYYFSHSFASKATFGVEPNFLGYKSSTLPLMFCGQSFGSQNRTDELFLAPAYETGWDFQHPSRSVYYHYTLFFPKVHPTFAFFSNFCTQLRFLALFLVYEKEPDLLTG